MGRVRGSPRSVILLAGAVALAIGVFATLRLAGGGPFFGAETPATAPDEDAPPEAGLPVAEVEAHLAGGAAAGAASVPDAKAFGRVHARILRGVDRAPVPGVPVMVEVLVDGARRTKAIGWSDDRGETLVEKVPPGVGYRVRVQPAAQPAVDRDRRRGEGRGDARARRRRSWGPGASSTGSCSTRPANR